MSTKQINVQFLYNNIIFHVKCTQKDTIREIIQQFINKCNKDSKIRDYNFYYEDNLIMPDSYDEPIEKNELFDREKDIIILAEKNLKIINCPECNYGDCVVNLKDYRTAFYNCQCMHLKISSYGNYFSDQLYYPEKIYCKECSKNGKPDSLIFQCLTCSKLLGRVNTFCKDCAEKNHLSKKHEVINYEDKNYYCWKHIQKMTNFCFECKRNFCEVCVQNHLKVEETKNHHIKNYDLLTPEENEINDLKNSLDTIKKYKDDLKIVVDDLIYNLKGAVRLYENYYKIANHIINKYETFNKGKEDFKNFTIFRCLYNLKFSNQQISKDLKEIIYEKDRIKRAEIIMNKYLNNKKYYYFPDMNSEDNPNNEDYNEWLNEVLKREEKRNSKNNTTSI